MSIIESLQQSIKDELDKFNALQKQLEDYIDEAQNQGLNQSDEFDLSKVGNCYDEE